VAGSEGRRPAKKSDGGTRVRRVEQSVREEVSSLVADEVKDPRAAGAVVTRVQMGADLRVARVYVRLLEETDEPSRRREVVEALRRASGMLRREVTQRLGLRYAPEIRFEYDEGTDHLTSVERVLAEIAADRRLPKGG
jgi:ribosome-binding factor A